MQTRATGLPAADRALRRLPRVSRPATRRCVACLLCCAFAGLVFMRTARGLAAAVGAPWSPDAGKLAAHTGCAAGRRLSLHAAMLQRQDRYCGRARAPAVSPGALEQGLLCWLRNSLGCRWVTHRAPPETATSLAKHTGPTQGRHANFACGACMAWKACAGGAALRRRQAWARLRGHHEADEAVVALRVLEAHLVLRARAKRACENTTFRCAARILHKLASAHAARA